MRQKRNVKNVLSVARVYQSNETKHFLFEGLPFLFSAKQHINIVAIYQCCLLASYIMVKNLRVSHNLLLFHPSNKLQNMRNSESVSLTVFVFIFFSEYIINILYYRAYWINCYIVKALKRKYRKLLVKIYLRIRTSVVREMMRNFFVNDVHV